MLPIGSEWGLADSSISVPIHNVSWWPVILNVGLGLFNLIPLPPLDGSKVLCAFLPYNVEMSFRNNEQIFYIVFLVIWITGLSSVIITPIFSAVFQGLDFIVASIFKLLGLL